MAISRGARSVPSVRLQERINQAADHMAAVLQHSLSDLESWLTAVPGPGGNKPPAGVSVLVDTREGLSVNPPGCLV